MRYKNGKGVGANYGQTYIDALKGIGIMMMIAGSLEICPGESVVRVPFEVGKAVLSGVGFKDSLLRADLSRINSPENMTFCPEQFTCHKNMVTCSKKDVNTCNMNEIGIY